MDILYFDNAATTKVKDEVLNEMIPFFLDKYGNASSAYSIGRDNKKAIEEARKKVAELIGAKPREIYFTSSGSESDNTALKGYAYANRKKGNHIITSKIEHPAILESCKTLEKQGFRITYLNVDNEGMVDLQELRKSITKQTILISIMFANNEIGTIEPVEEISKIAKANNIAFHTDSVQAVGNVEIDVNKMKIDMLSLSGHKFYGPKGIGALYVKEGIDFLRFIDGGHQERNKRAGTENVPAIVGLGKAAELAKENLNEHIKHLQELRNYFIEEIENNIFAVKLNGSRENRLPGNSNISFRGIDGNAILYDLDLKGICISTGSACSSGSDLPSHVLKSIGLDDDWINGTIRVTFSEDNTKDDIDYLVKSIKQCIEKVK
ncbi:MAG: cysteine desulfurase NifS [Clostridia bacterium]|nr:cysteine desulfurase NifS [Clostridia bacterium]